MCLVFGRPWRGNAALSAGERGTGARGGGSNLGEGAVAHGARGGGEAAADAVAAAGKFFGEAGDEVGGQEIGAHENLSVHMRAGANPDDGDGRGGGDELDEQGEATGVGADARALVAADAFHVLGYEADVAPDGYAAGGEAGGVARATAAVWWSIMSSVTGQVPGRPSVVLPTESPTGITSTPAAVAWRAMSAS